MTSNESLKTAIEYLKQARRQMGHEDRSWQAILPVEAALKALGIEDWSESQEV